MMVLCQNVLRARAAKAEMYLGHADGIAKWYK
jgi:hypothetical protein